LAVHALFFFASTRKVLFLLLLDASTRKALFLLLLGAPSTRKAASFTPMKQWLQCRSHAHATHSAQPLRATHGHQSPMPMPYVLSSFVRGVWVRVWAGPSPSANANANANKQQAARG
jgi:hypothetical protein